MTLAQLRALLALAHGPAVERLTTIVDPSFGVTPRAIAWHYLTRNITLHGEMVGWFLPDLMGDLDGQGNRPLNLTDPGTVNAVRVALALALGLDPGPMGCAVAWRAETGGWRCEGVGAMFRLRDRTPPRSHFSGARLHDVADRNILHAPAVAAEPDAIKALVLAVEHVLATS